MRGSSQEKPRGLDNNMMGVIHPSSEIGLGISSN